MLSPPPFDQTPFPEQTAQKIRHEFHRGIADRYHPNDLVRSGVALYHPLHGGIFKRREPVKYIIIHSTETGPPVSAKSVIDAWSSLGRRHAGAQYVVERDGRIYQSCEPDYATVHVNIFKTLPGINNDNSIGIEMNHTGKQSYPREQREAVIKLTSYLQDRYHVLHENIITHRYAQQGDHTDPVAFDFDEFLASKEAFHNKALAMKRELGPSEVADIVAPPPTVYMEMHKTVNSDPAVPPAAPPVAPSVAPPSTPPVATEPTQPVEPTDTALTPKETGAPVPKLRTEIELAPDRAVMMQDSVPSAAPDATSTDTEEAPKPAPNR
jgi:hypothetical protein